MLAWCAFAMARLVRATRSSTNPVDPSDDGNLEGGRHIYSRAFPKS